MGNVFKRLTSIKVAKPSSPLNPFKEKTNGSYLKVFDKYQSSTTRMLHLHKMKKQDKKSYEFTFDVIWEKAKGKNQRKKHMKKADKNMNTQFLVEQKKGKAAVLGVESTRSDSTAT